LIGTLARDTGRMIRLEAHLELLTGATMIKKLKGD
jgi:hypothetical protein